MYILIRIILRINDIKKNNIFIYTCMFFSKVFDYYYKLIN